LQEFYTLKNDIEHLLKLDSRFHDILFHIQRARNASFESPGRAKKVLEEHKAIYEAVVARDADRAEQMTKEHVKKEKSCKKGLFDAGEFEEFLKSYDMPRFYGLRVNTLKTFELEPIPWTKDGFYYNEGENPGKHPYYHAGLYYIQEPSAMLPGAVINAEEGDYVLDLCAAPGGKMPMT